VRPRRGGTVRLLGEWLELQLADSKQEGDEPDQAIDLDGAPEKEEDLVQVMPEATPATTGLCKRLPRVEQLIPLAHPCKIQVTRDSAKKELAQGPLTGPRKAILPGVQAAKLPKGLFPISAPPSPLPLPAAGPIHQACPLPSPPSDYPAAPHDVAFPFLPG